MKQRGEYEEHMNRFERLALACRNTRSQRKSCALGCAGSECSSYVERPASVYVGGFFACRDYGSSLHRPAIPCAGGLSPFVHTDSHTVQKSPMKRQTRKVWRRLSSWPKYYPRFSRKPVTTNEYLPFVAATRYNTNLPEEPC